MIEIKNLRREKPSQPYDFRIDRGTPVGNPFYMSGEHMRETVCQDYAQWFADRLGGYSPAFNGYLAEIESVYKTHGRVRLFCWCAPKRCHGETIKNYLEFKLGG